MDFFARLFDNRGLSDVASIPDVQPALAAHLQTFDSQRRQVFQPVAGSWRVGVVVQWMKSRRSPRIAQIASVQPGGVGRDLRCFNYLGDGSVMLLRLVEVDGIPVLRPVAPKRPDGGSRTARGECVQWLSVLGDRVETWMILGRFRTNTRVGPGACRVS